MGRIRVIPAIIFLLAFIAVNLFTECAAAVKQQVVILDLPYLNLLEFSGAYPNLLKLVSTGSTGLVTVPASSLNRGFDSLGLRIIGETLPKDSIRTAAIGDTGGNLPGQSKAVIIDGNSIIGIGLGPESLKDKSYLPYSFRTGTDSILKYYRLFRNRAGVIVITPGDLEWIEGYRRYRGKDREEYYRQKILRYYDYLIARISTEIDFGTTLLVVYSSWPPEKHEITNTALACVVLKGLDFEAGILYSPSTRKKGIVTYNDLRYSILRFLNSKTKAVFQIRNIPGEWRTIATSQPALVKNYSIRWPLLTGYGYSLLGVVFLFVVGLFFRLHQKVISILAWVYLFLLTVPAAFLVEALINPLNWVSITFYTLVISGVLFLLSYFLARRNIFQALLWVSSLTAGLVLIDGMFNGYYEFKSFLGYSVVTGARYYGIGNEYMGILLGAYIVGVSLGFQRIWRWSRIILWSAAIFIGLVLIHPYFGADVGGGITALMGLGITNYLWLKQPIRIREIAHLFVLTLLALVFAGAWDLWIDHNSMSHLGQLLLSIRNNGVQAFVALVIRKMALNLRLISNTPFSLVLIGILLIIPFLYRYPPAPIKKFMAKHAEIISGLTGLAITALIGLLANDSGIVSAAMIFMFGIGLIMLVSIPIFTKISSHHGE